MDDLISRQAAIDAIRKIYDSVGILGEKWAVDKCQMAIKDLPSAQPEPCEDTVSRQRLLSDLKELVAAWKKYPVMAEQIKGVEAAIGYVETIPSAQPEQRWIPCSERLPEEGVNVLLCIKDWESQKTKMVVSLRRDYNYWDGLGREIRGDIAWMPLPEPYNAETK